MVCDYLRSCYQTRARFHPGSSFESPIIWYWAKEGAQLLPFGSSIRSLNWLEEGEDGPPAIGEVVGAPRTWRSGSIARLPRGQEAHGDPFYYNEGDSAGLVVDRFPSGPLIDCFTAVQPQGGLGLGGQAWVGPYSPPVETVPCPGVLVAGNLAVDRFDTEAFEVLSDLDPATTRGTYSGVPAWVLRTGVGFNAWQGYSFPNATVSIFEAGSVYAAHVAFDAPTGDQQFVYDVDLGEHYRTCDPWELRFLIPYNGPGILHECHLYLRVKM